MPCACGLLLFRHGPVGLLKLYEADGREHVAYHFRPEAAAPKVGAEMTPAEISDGKRAALERARLERGAAGAGACCFKA